jgi:Family of unknown function (DUF6297)
MVVSVLVNLSRESDRACVSAGCQGARAMLPWLVAAGALVVLLTLARLLGPVFVSPAAASWLLPTPVDRPGLLLLRLLSIGGIFAMTGGMAAAVGGILGGLGAGAVTLLASSCAAMVAAAVGIAGLAQSRPGGAARSLDRALAVAAWIVLVATAAGRPLLRDPVRSVGLGWWVMLVASLAAAAAAAAAALHRLDALHARSVTPGGRLLPAVSGALSGLDLALAYDVVVAHQSRTRGFVRSRRGGPSGLGALVRLDLVRLRRHPGPLVLLLASLAVPAAARAAGGGRVVILIAALVGFLAGLPLLVALRVVSRTPALARTLPFRTSTVVQATVTVPAVVLLLFGEASVPILHSAARSGWLAAALTGLAVAASALASGIRWMTARPPDYARPLVSTPAGGVPTNLYGSVFRGFDVLLVTTTPVLLTARPQGAVISLAISLAVAAYLLRRDR